VGRGSGTQLGVRWGFHLVLAGSTAAVVCVLDLGSKWVATEGRLDTLRFNQRPTALLVPFLVVALALLVATSVAGSGPLDLAAGTLAGGAFGNIASVLVWREGIPDFIPAGGVLLNGGDLAIAVGLTGLIAASLVMAGREVRLGRGLSP
jgi:hypothetical protein